MVAELGVTTGAAGLSSLRDLIASGIPSLEILTDPDRFEEFLEKEHALLLRMDYGEVFTNHIVDSLRARFARLFQGYDDDILDESLKGEALKDSVRAFIHVVCDDRGEDDAVFQCVLRSLCGLALISADMAGTHLTGPHVLYSQSVAMGSAYFSKGVKVPVAA
jgi:hypothetical protein